MINFDKVDGSIQHPGSPPTSNPLTNAHGVPAQTVLIRVTDARVSDAGLRDALTGATQDLSAPQTAALRGLPLVVPVTRHLSSLGDYRLIAARAADGDLITTGLPLAPLHAVLHRLVAAAAGVSLTTLLVSAVVAGLLIRRTLRPLERIAATAGRVSELPLDHGEVALPMRVPDADPRTEAGRVGAALNLMLGHVAGALAARHAAESQLRRFSADASHELRTPLGAIRGYAELARRRDLPPDVSHAVRRIESETDRMTVPVGDLLRLARLDADQPPATAPVDLSWLVADAVSEAHTAGPDHHWRLDLPDAPVVVTGDEESLRRMVTNLLTNARVHTPAGTSVTAQLEVQPGKAMLRVVDDGPGIAADLLPTAFDRFTRGGASRHRPAGSGLGFTRGGASRHRPAGSGLGLAIVRAIAEAHGGGVEVTSRAGRTAFTVGLPLAT